MSGKEQFFRTLNGTTAAKSNIVGYCRLHHVHLTEPQIRQKKCVSKNCFYLKKWEHGFWDRRERMKEIKQIKKDAGIPPWEKVDFETERGGSRSQKQKG